MKRKIKNLIVKYCKLRNKTAYDVVLDCSKVVGIVILGLIGFLSVEPKKMTSSDIEYCKERIEKISKSNFWESVEIINQLGKKGYSVEIDYETFKITIGYAYRNSEKIIFQKTKNEDISFKQDYSNAENLQIIGTILVGAAGVIVGPVVITIILAIFLVIGYIIECIQEIAEEIKKLKK